MIEYTSQFQAKIEEFSSFYQLNLYKNNRWVQLSFLLPWDEMVGIYSRRFSAKLGAKAVNPRIVIGAFIIKHKLGLSDEETPPDDQRKPLHAVFLRLA